MKSTLNSTLSRENQKPHEKDLVLKKKKEETKHFYLACGNYRETARIFQLQDSTVHKICEAALPEKSESRQGFKGGKGWKGNAEGAVRPLSYPASIDEELLSWLLIMDDLHLPVSISALQKKAKSLMLPHNPCFETSRGWVRQFKEIHNLALRKKTSLCQIFHPNLKVKYHHFVLNAPDF